MNLTELSTVQVYTTPLRNYEHFPNHDMGKKTTQQQQQQKQSNKKKKNETNEKAQERETNKGDCRHSERRKCC